MQFLKLNAKANLDLLIHRLCCVVHVMWGDVFYEM